MPIVIDPVVVTSALRLNSAIFDKRPHVAMGCLLGTLYQTAPRLLIPSSRLEEPDTQPTRTRATHRLPTVRRRRQRPSPGLLVRRRSRFDATHDARRGKSNECVAIGGCDEDGRFRKSETIEMPA